MRRSSFARLVGGALLAAGVALTLASPASAADSTASARTVAPTTAQLSAAQDRLDQASETRPTNVTGWYVDQRAKSLVVEVHGADLGVAEWAAGLDVADVQIRKVAAAPQPYWSLIGGQAITTGGSRCSLGFNARTSGYRYVITAGHCTNLGGVWSGRGGRIGPVVVSSFPGNDYGIIRVDSSSASSTPLVDRYRSGGDVTVVGAANAYRGMAVCRSGSTTGWHCGTVTGVNRTVCYPQGCVYQMIRTDVCAEPGDSGGSLVTRPSGSRVYAVGMTSGGSGNCTRGGTTYYQPVTEVLSTYSNLSLITG